MRSHTDLAEVSTTSPSAPGSPAVITDSASRTSAAPVDDNQSSVPERDTRDSVQTSGAQTKAQLEVLPSPFAEDLEKMEQMEVALSYETEPDGNDAQVTPKNPFAPDSGPEMTSADGGNTTSQFQQQTQGTTQQVAAWNPFA
jgi:hypothetical protein